MKLALALLLAASAWGAEVVASSCSRDHVNTAVGSASDGDTILIPNGSCTWTSGITTTKQIIIRAQNYTPTSGGTATRNVVLTNNSTAIMFAMQSGNSYHVGVGGIRFDEGTGDVNAVRFTGTGSKVPLLFDCHFENKARFGAAEDAAVISWLSQGGVAWNISMDGSDFGEVEDQGPSIASVAIHLKSPRAWATASTMGTLDTGGAVNVYIEDSSFLNTGGVDIDDNARLVGRYSVIDGCTWITHGFTSSFGGRWVELYNNTFQMTVTPRNVTRYFWFRAGSGIFTDNVVNNTTAPSDYGSTNLFDIGDNTSPGSYPMARQPGWGHNGTNNVIDPIYAWNNTGARATSYAYQNGWDAIVQDDREVFVGAAAKPSYTKYTYPHPAREAVEGESEPPAGPRARTAGKASLSGNAKLQ